MFNIIEDKMIQMISREKERERERERERKKKKNKVNIKSQLNETFEWIILYTENT